MRTIFKILAINLLFLMTACSKDKENCNPNDERSACFVGVGSGDKLLLTEQKLNGQLTARYEYNNQNKMTKVQTYNGTGTIEYSYNSKGFLEYVESKDDKGKVGITTTYIYGNSGRPTSAQYFINNEKYYTTQYTYAKNKMVESSTYESGILVVVTYTYDDKGNFLTQESSLNGELISRIEQGDYDDKHAPGVNGNPHHWVIYSPNNHRFLKTTMSDASLNSDLILKYTYNHAGYPTKVEEYNRKTNTLVTTRTYSYIPAK